jgi:hypothetical protein
MVSSSAILQIEKEQSGENSRFGAVHIVVWLRDTISLPALQELHSRLVLGTPPAAGYHIGGE